MDVRHIVSLQGSVNSRPPVAVGVYIGGVIVASTGGAGNKVTLHHLPSNKNELMLSSHANVVSALAMSHATPLQLCSASTDAVKVWDLSLCPESGSTSGQLLPLPSISRSEISHTCFSPDASYVAVCRETETIVFDVKSCSLDTTLVGHTAPVTCAVFSPHTPHTIITASYDRTFKVWDLASSALLYQSAIVSASPFLCISVAPHKNLLATGTADGVLRVYDLSLEGRYACLHKCDVGKEVEKLTNVAEIASLEARPSVIQSGPPWQQSHDSHAASCDAPVEVSPAILGVHYWLTDSDKDEDNCYKGGLDHLHKHLSETHISDVLKSPHVLLISTQLGLLALNAETLDTLHCLDLREPLVSIHGGSTHCTTCIPAVATCSFAYNDQDQKMYCALGALFNGTVSILGIRGCNGNLAAVEAKPSESSISVLSRVPLVANSPLKAEFSLKTKEATSMPVAARRSKAKSGGVSDQPLTFKSKVKSSGYTEAPRPKMFVPKTQSKSQKSSSQKRTSSEVTKREYLMTCGPTVHLHHSTQLSDRSTPVNCACFAGSGWYLACGCADKTAYILKMPPSTGKTHTVVGHDGAVVSVGWSHSGEWLLTSSTDRSARVWEAGGQHKDPAMTLSTTLHNFKSEKTAIATAQLNQPFAKEITKAQFYYLDKFILLSSGNTVYMYKYHIDATKPDDIKRYCSNTHYKLVTALSMESAQTITTMSAINDFHSYIVLVGGSNKTLSVFDMNVGKSVLTLPNVHSRPVHCIQQNKGSRYVTHLPDAYDLFLTSAVTDGIKLWDLRSNRCVSRFNGHLNQSQPVGATFSPCARYIATGSEDRAAYVYDIRSSSPLHKLPGHSDAVMSVSYHPLKPLLATGTLDGYMNFFTDSIGK